MKLFLKLIITLLPIIASSQNIDMIKNLDDTKKKELLNILTEDSKVSIFSTEHQKYLDTILSIVPNDAFFWQQKAMPLLKQKKYELGMKYLNKAVELDTTTYYREYRAFIKCIFQKNYTESLNEFIDLLKINGDGVVMDHTYSFWIGLCYLQLNEFALSKEYIEKSISFSKTNNIVNPYEVFYLGVIEFETGDYFKALEIFDLSISNYKNFADAKYYKALSLAKINKNDEAKIFFSESKNDFKNGNSFNEGNSQYEQFPYQVSKFIYSYTEEFFKLN